MICAHLLIIERFKLHLITEKIHIINRQTEQLLSEKHTLIPLNYLNSVIIIRLLIGDFYERSHRLRFIEY